MLTCSTCAGMRARWSSCCSPMKLRASQFPVHIPPTSYLLFFRFSMRCRSPRPTTFPLPTGPPSSHLIADPSRPSLFPFVSTELVPCSCLRIFARETNPTSRRHVDRKLQKRCFGAFYSYAFACLVLRRSFILKLALEREHRSPVHCECVSTIYSVRTVHHPVKKKRIK